MDKLVPVLNQLQNVLGILGAHSISLPQLVVVGSQSSGKSSVLENIVGRDFLPRGTNIVTRRPLILQLLNTSDGANSSSASNSTAPGGGSGAGGGKEWGEFEHVEGRFYDFHAIKREIERETERLTGKGTAISAVPIFLRIFSSTVPNLTLVDLPGITKVATGDQPADIERQIRDMLLHFISNPNSIIVAVSPATEDIANSEALKIAREVDPKCARTIGVLTKLDLMDPGTDAKRILQNQAIPLQLGYVGVINRGQKDIVEGKPIHAALVDERAYFERSVYSSMAARMGTQYLTKRLTTLLLTHLQTFLPVIRQQILATIQETEKELEGYGDPLSLEVLFSTAAGGIVDSDVMTGAGIPRTDEERLALRNRLMGPLMLDLLSKFAAHYVEALDGRSSDIYTDSPQLIGGARIAFVFNDIFGAHLDNIAPFDYLSDADIRMAIRNATGPRPTLFLPEMAFDLLVKKQIERLRSPAIECVDMVFEELQRVATQCEASAMPQLSRFPNLRDALLRCVKGLLAGRVAPTKSTVNNLVNIELAYINTNHPDFIGGSRALNQLAQQRKMRQQQQMAGAGSAGAGKDGSGGGGGGGKDGSGSSGKDGSKDGGASGSDASLSAGTGDGSFSLKPPSDRENVETDVIKLLISSYFDIVKKTIKDTVPKSIMLFLVNKTKQDIQSELVRHLYKEDQFPQLLQEADDISEKRDSCAKLIRLMRKALEVVNQIHDVQL